MIWKASALCAALFLCAAVVSAQEIKEVKSVQYGTADPAQVLSAQLLVQEKPSPVVVIIPGGGWRGGGGGAARGGKSPLTAGFNKAGFSTVTIDHRSVEKYPWPAQFEDAARAVQFLRSKVKEWNIDPDRISVMGRSSGGHLAMMVGFLPDQAKPDSEDRVERESTKVRCVINMSGPTDLVAQVKGLTKKREDGSVGAPRALIMLVGMKEEDAGSEEFYKALRKVSPTTYVTKSTPPVFIQYVGPEDATSPEDPRLKWAIHTPISGLILAEKLKEFGVPHEVFIRPEFGENMEKAIERQVAFLKKHNDMK